MTGKPTLLLSLLLCACGQQDSSQGSAPIDALSQSEREHGTEEAEAKVLAVLGETGGSTWVNWPTDQRHFSGADKACIRVSEQSREAGIRLLSGTPARVINGKDYESLTGQPAPDAVGTAYLLRGFSTSNSTARVTTAGGAVTVHSDALGGVGNIRRHPCVAILNSAPPIVYTVVAYDL